MVCACKQGHALEKKKLGKMEGWVHSRGCQYCYSRIDRRAVRYHCNRCKVDVCNACAIGRVHSQSEGDNEQQQDPTLPPLLLSSCIYSTLEDRLEQPHHRLEQPSHWAQPVVLHGSSQRARSAEPSKSKLSLPRSSESRAHANGRQSELIAQNQHLPKSTSAGPVFGNTAAVLALPPPTGSSERQPSKPTATASLPMEARAQSPARGRSPARARSPSGQLLSGAATCSNGHPLSQNVRGTPGCSNTCNSCGRAGILPPEHVFSCEQCDFDLCQSCYGLTAQMCPTPLATAPSLQPERRAPRHGSPARWMAGPTPNRKLVILAPATANTQYSNFPASGRARRTHQKRVSFATHVEWMFFEDEEGVDQKVVSMRVPLRSDAGKKIMLGPCWATWCPRGSACAEHGGAIWPDAVTRAAAMEIVRQQGAPRCPFEQPPTECRRCDFAAWGPDTAETDSDCDEPPPLMPCARPAMPWPMLAMNGMEHMSSMNLQKASPYPAPFPPPIPFCNPPASPQRLQVS